MTGVIFPGGSATEFFSLCHPIQTISEAHPASYSMIMKALSLGVKQPGHDTDHSPPSSAEVKNAQSSLRR